MGQVEVPLDGELLVGEWVKSGRDDRAVRRHPALVRVRRGSYADAQLLADANDDERYDLRIRAVLGTRRSPLVLSHQSAARMQRLPIASRWPLEVHATVHPNSPRRSKNGVVIHRHALADDELVEVDGVLLTSVKRTALDVAKTAPLRDGVALFDYLLRERVVSHDDLIESLDSLGDVRGRVPARRAIDFASPLSGSVGESFSRVLIHELGFPAPELQQEFAHDGKRRFADFWWSSLRLIGEFDGKSKYEQDGLDVMWQEKLRENELRNHRLTLTRWAWPDLIQPDRLVARLETAGLRRRRPRGYSALSGR